MSARVLLFDIETSPMLLAGFGLHNQNFSIDQIIEQPRIMGFSAKWYGSGKKAKWYSEYHNGREVMLERARDMFEEAQFVAGWNSHGFDEPWFHGEFRREGLEVPSPVKSIDLWRIAKKNMRWPSTKLAYVAPMLAKDAKLSTGGFKLWRDCLWGDEDTQRKAWAQMRRYGLQDTDLLEPIFDELRPYFPANINLALAGGNGELVCPVCESEHVQRRGHTVSQSGRYKRFQCQDCGTWSQETRMDPDEPKAALKVVAR